MKPIQQENPYQVKNRRFKRTHNQSQLHVEASLEKWGNLATVKSSHQIRNSSFFTTLEPGKKGISKEREGSSLEKQQLRRKRENQEDEEWREKQANMLRIISQKQKRIDELQRLLKSKDEENRVLTEKVAKCQQTQRMAAELQRELREELCRLQTCHSEETYNLKQIVRKLQIDVNCLNRKWTLDFDRMLKEKELECKSLREKYTGLLRSKRQNSRQSSVITQVPSSLSSFPSEPRFDNELLDFSSFELSKEDALQY